MNNNIERLVRAVCVLVHFFSLVVGQNFCLVSFTSFVGRLAEESDLAGIAANEHIVHPQTMGKHGERDLILSFPLLYYFLFFVFICTNPDLYNWWWYLHFLLPNWWFFVCVLCPHCWMCSTIFVQTLRGGLYKYKSSRKTFQKILPSVSSPPLIRKIIEVKWLAWPIWNATPLMRPTYVELSLCDLVRTQLYFAGY